MYDYVGNIASFVGSLTVVGSALLWVYNKFIGAPREQRRNNLESVRNRQMVDAIKKENKPLNDALTALSESFKESITDRESLNRKVKKNFEMIEKINDEIDDNNIKIARLEIAVFPRSRIEEFSYKGGE